MEEKESPIYRKECEAYLSKRMRSLVIKKNK